MEGRKMTTNDTWDRARVKEYLNLSDYRTRLLYILFSDMLELDIEESMRLAKENEEYRKELKQKLDLFKESYLELRTLLKKVSRESSKF